MKIGIIGIGSVGGALGRLWAARGHEVLFGAREPRGAKAMDVLSKAKGNARMLLVADAASGADVIVLATPFDATRDAIAACGSLAGRVVVDTTNPLAPRLAGLSIGHTTSAAETIAGWAKGAHVVKAFNTIGAGSYGDPIFGNQRATMFYCGDDGKSKRRVQQLIDELGFDPVDAGPLTQARLLEPLAMLWISLAVKQGLGGNIAIKLLRR